MITLLTGASGFLGKEIIKQVELGTIITLARKEAQICYDLSTGIPTLPNTNLVIHCAGKAHMVPKTELERNEFFLINVEGTKNLLKGLSKTEILPQKFVFISSVAVYGKEFGELFSEKTSLDANDAYGKSKIEAEKLILEWCEQNNIICSILRLPLLIGENPPGNLLSMINGIKKGYYFNIAGGKAKKSMVLINDVAKIIPIVARIGGVYNLTDGYNPSFKELAEHIARQLSKAKPLNIPGWVAVILAKIGDILGGKSPINSNKLNKITTDLTFDDSLARNNFNWNPGPVLEGFTLYQK